MGGREKCRFHDFQEKLEKPTERSKCQAEIRHGRREKLGVHRKVGKLAKVLFSGKSSRKQLFSYRSSPLAAQNSGKQLFYL